MTHQRQLIVAVMLLSVFFGLWAVHEGILLNAAERRISSAQEVQLNSLGELILAKLDDQRETLFDGPFAAYTVAGETGVARIVILNQDGTVQVDSKGQRSPGESLPGLGIPVEDLNAAWNGTPIVTAGMASNGGEFVRLLFRAISDADGSTLGLLRVTVEVPPPLEATEGVLFGFFLKLFGSIAFAVILYTTLRSIRKTGKGSADPSEQDETMVTTFQGLVRQLKEKELELEEMKRRAEQRAEAVEGYNENILQSVASGVITFDKNRIITTFNPSAERVLRLNRKDMINRPCEEVFGKESSITRMLEEVLDREMVISRQEFELHRPLVKRPPADTPLDWVSRERSRPQEERRQERIWVGVSTSLLRDRAGQVIGATFVFTDLTEIKHLQEQVELKRRLTVLGEMSAGIAHEFRNFMGTILGFSRLISKRLEPQDPRQGMVQAITREIKDMDRLIEQLLSFGRHTEINLAPVDIEAFLHKQILHVLSQTSDIHRPKLKLVIPPDLPRAEIDEVLMRQALNNLLQNALDAMPDGGELRVEVRVIHRSGAGGRSTEELQIEIGDTGIGIPGDKLEKIFLPFFTTKEKGTGMGLALVHKIIISHNGRIEAESMEERGTVFRIHLPLKEGLVS